jgi:hypothetical protein
MAGGGIEPPTSEFLVHVSHDGKLFASAAAIQPSAALEAGLMEQEQHHPCPAVWPTCQSNSPQAQIADSSSTNAVTFND